MMSEIAARIKEGGIGVVPTDTLYGVVGSALSKRAVMRIYRVRKRNRRKPLIVLIGSLKDLQRFDIKPDLLTKGILKKFWPGPVSIILPCSSRKFLYLHRASKGIAFRLPKKRWLRMLLRMTGPLVAPSVNIEGKPPAKTIREARRYFGDRVDFYVDIGKQDKKPSSLLKIEGNRIVKLR